MVYDYAKNKCLMTENFGNFFENYNTNNSIIEEFGTSCAKDLLLQTSFGFSNGILFHIPGNVAPLSTMTPLSS
jgi:hypothetical protein